MRSFRPLSAELREIPADLSPALTDLWRPAHFFLGQDLRCAWQFEAECDLPWEVFRGQLVEPRHCRETKRFVAWNLLPVENGAVSDFPLLSLLLEEAERVVHVTRGLRCRVWSPITGDASGIAGEETIGWVRELVGRTHVSDATSLEEFLDEVRSLIWHAIVGVSRLPLSSLEAPLPQFTLGQLAYVPRDSMDDVDARRPRRHGVECLSESPDRLGPNERAKILETLVRNASDDTIDATAAAYASWRGRDLLGADFLRMINDVSLSPYTEFVPRALRTLSVWFADSPADEIDALGRWLRTLTRHLTAYDLVVFHYRGANYPDALALDAIVHRLFVLARGHSALFAEQSTSGRLRRREIRMGCLLREHYQGHAVPDHPTSPGEQIRVMPESFGSVPPEQIEQPATRRRRLFDDSPLPVDSATREIVSLALADLALESELRELGTALFIDRPLGYFKAPAEIDQTPLLSYVAFSRRLAVARLPTLDRFARSFGCLPIPIDELRERLLGLTVTGLRQETIPEPRRPAVSLSDMRGVSDDFVVLRTTPGSRTAFWNALSMPVGDWPLIVRIRDENNETILAACDADGTVQARFEADWSAGARVRAGVEIPRAGLRRL